MSSLASFLRRAGAGSGFIPSALKQTRLQISPTFTNRFLHSTSEAVSVRKSPLSSALSNLDRRQQYSLFSTSRNSAPFSTARSEKTNQLQVEVVSAEYVKPAAPTPHYLRTYKVSSLEQFFPKNLYMATVYFYANNHPRNDSDIMLKRRKVLKQSLSKTLTRFYPLAGKVRDESRIDCNDDGVYYVEANVSGDRELSGFLDQINLTSINQLLPFDPSSVELSSKSDLIMVQVTTFGCGGIAVGLYFSHKIIDAYSSTIFLNAWGATCRGNQEQISPDFSSSSIFLPNPIPPQEPEIKVNTYTTKRFFFPNSSLMALKQKTGSTRVLATTGLIWKCAIAAAKARWDSPLPYVVFVPVNLRARSSPPLPLNSMGSIIWSATAEYRENGHDSGDLNSLVKLLKGSTDEIRSDFIEKLKGEEGMLKLGELIDEMEAHLNTKTEYLTITSLYNGGMYDVNFGWGRPVWVGVLGAKADVPLLKHTVYLIDRRNGDGIEAWVSLSDEDMAVFEQDPDLLAFASLNPSPLN